MRALQQDDCDAAAALIRRAFSNLPIRLDPLPSAGRITADDVRAHLASGAGGLMIDPDRACLLWAEQEGGLHVSRVAVDPEYRGQGLAAAMLVEAEAEARRRGLSHLTLATRLALTGNRRLFARHGYVEGALHSHPGYAAPTFVDLEKRLDGEPGGSPSVIAPDVPG